MKISSLAGKPAPLEILVDVPRPIAVSDRAATPEQAVSGATEKMKHLLETTLGRLKDR